MRKKKYLSIARHYEICLDRHGDTHRGVDWPILDDVDKRYRVMLDIIGKMPAERHTLLDLGCGASHLYDYMLRSDVKRIEYSGLDISEKFISLSREKYPENNYYCMDILDDPGALPQFDFIVINGVFTEKQALSYDEMLSFFQQMVACAFSKARIGLAFNVMTKHVEWERDDLFHLPFDVLAAFLVDRVSRHFVIRSDYGLYEYTTYVFREPRQMHAAN